MYGYYYYCKDYKYCRWLHIYNYIITHAWTDDLWDLSYSNRSFTCELRWLFTNNLLIIAHSEYSNRTVINIAYSEYALIKQS